MGGAPGPAGRFAGLDAFTPPSAARGEHPAAEDRLWQIDPIARLDFVGDVELKLGVAFRDEDVEFLETPSDLIERGAEILIRGGVR